MLEINWDLNKSVYINLLKIKGISHTTANKLCSLLGISKRTKYSELVPSKLDQLNLLLSFYKKKTYPFILNSLTDLDVNVKHNNKQEFIVGITKTNNIIHAPMESNLKEFNKTNLVNLVKINSYRGRRFKQGYPVKGQRTRCNGETARKLNKIYIK